MASPDRTEADMQPLEVPEAVWKPEEPVEGRVNRVADDQWRGDFLPTLFPSDVGEPEFARARDVGGERGGAQASWCHRSVFATWVCLVCRRG